MLPKAIADLQSTARGREDTSSFKNLHASKRHDARWRRRHHRTNRLGPGRDATADEESGPDRTRIASSVSLEGDSASPTRPGPGEFDVTVAVDELDHQIQQLRRLAIPAGATLQEAGQRLRRNLLTLPPELESQLTAYAAAYARLQTILNLDLAARPTFADFDQRKAGMERSRRAAELVADARRLTLKTGSPSDSLPDDLSRRLDDVMGGLAGPDAEGLIRMLLDGQHPLNDLLSLVMDGGTLDDERWDALMESVAGFFGTPIARAAARGKLIHSNRP